MNKPKPIQQEQNETTNPNVQTPEKRYRRRVCPPEVVDRGTTVDDDFVAVKDMRKRSKAKRKCETVSDAPQTFTMTNKDEEENRASKHIFHFV